MFHMRSTTAAGSAGQLYTSQILSEYQAGDEYHAGDFANQEA
jgi:hypothetical protein